MIQGQILGVNEMMASYFVHLFWNPCGQSPFKVLKWNLEN